MSFELHKVCPSCDGEFQMHVERCPDCGRILVLAEPEPPWVAVPRPVRDPQIGLPVPEGYALGSNDVPESEDLVHLGISGEPDEVREVSVLLSQERLRHWLVPRDVKEILAAYHKPQDYMDVYVREQDLDSAAAAVRRHLWRDLPEGRDVSTALADAGRCPACSATIPATGAGECPECGLGLAG